MYHRRGRFWGMICVAFGAGLVISPLIPAFILSVLVGLGLIVCGCFLCR
ncbi:MAG: hypothetical protein FWH16_05440 [Oscillospiraceae bacterium]|nr:hypothetical protein [Oscillospiraceae bacterium]